MNDYTMKHICRKCGGAMSYTGNVEHGFMEGWSHEYECRKCGIQRWINEAYTEYEKREDEMWATIRAINEKNNPSGGEGVK